MMDKAKFSYYGKFHYLGRFLLKFPMNPILRAILISIGAYLLFLFFALISGWNQVMGSFLHIWQISFSITIFTGLWLGDIAIRDIENLFIRLEENLRLDDKVFKKFIDKLVTLIKNTNPHIFAIPIIVVGLIFGYKISQTLPNQFIPISGTSAVFIYVVYIELSIFMLHLVGGTGFWLFFILSKGASYLSNLYLGVERFIDKDSLNFYSDKVLKLCVFLFIIFATAIPGLVYVGNSLGDTIGRFVAIGLLIPAVGLFLSFFGPIYFLKQIISQSKIKKLREIQNQLVTCEIRLKNLKLSNNKKNHNEESAELKN